jgi:hypothetical protein
VIHSWHTLGRATIAIIVTMLVACGGGGGGSPSSASEGPLLAADAGIYVPASAPIKHFRGRDSRVTSPWPAVGYANTETWTGSDAARTLNETNSLNEGAGATVSGSNVQLSIASDGVHDLSGRWLATDVVMLRSPVRQNDQYTAVDKTVSVANGSVRVVVTVHVVGNEAVNVPGGTFSSALKVVTSATLTGAATAVTLTSSDWYVASIGRVKTEYIDGAASAGYRGNTVTEELAGYRDSTSAFGYLANEVLFSDRAMDYTKAPAAIESDGNGYLVALSQGQWISNNSLEGGGPVIGTLVGSNARGGATFTLIDSARHGGYSPAVVSTGPGYLVVSGDRTQLVAQRVTSAGTTLDGRSGTVIYSSAQFVLVPSMARLGSRILLAWTEGTGNDDGSMLSRAMLLDATTGQPVSPPVTITSPTGSAGYPRVVAGNDGYLLVFSGWSDSRNYFLARAWSATLYASRIDTGGQLLDAQPVALSDAGTAHSVADVRFNGSDYVVTWADNRNHLLADHAGVYPPEDANTGTFMQDVFMTRVSPLTGTVPSALAQSGSSTTATNAYRDSPGLAIGLNQAVEVHNVFASDAASGLYFRWLDPAALPASLAGLPDNAYALDTLPTYSYPSGIYGLSQIACNAQSALVVFFGAPISSGGYAALRASMILPRANR